MYGVPSFLPPHIQNTTNKEHHRALRKALAPGFSDASLRAQEPIITKYIMLLIQRLKLKSRQGPVNMELWYRYVVFDIICDLAFGSSFQCLESDGLHPWSIISRVFSRFGKQFLSILYLLLNNPKIS
jgi:cytochrome P450